LLVLFVLGIFVFSLFPIPEDVFVSFCNFWGFQATRTNSVKMSAYHVNVLQLSHFIIFVRR